MSDTPQTSTDDLQFDTAEPAGANMAARPSQSCAICSQPIVSMYYALGDGMLCPACHETAIAPAGGSRFGRLVKASLLGLCAGLVGALIWFVIRRVTDHEFGLVAILVGVMVGAAVRKGSAGVGGRGYQVLAVLITYGCIAANYMPDILELVVKAAREKHAQAGQLVAAKPGVDNAAAPGAQAGEPADKETAGAAQEPPAKVGVGGAIAAVALIFVVVFALSMAAPFFAGTENLIGLLIIGFALWEAWKLNARRPLPISGPYQLGSDPVPSPSA